jgi:hypothetical protein
LRGAAALVFQRRTLLEQPVPQDAALRDASPDTLEAQPA